MCKKLILFLSICSISSISTYADDIAMNFALMNNYNVRQSDNIWDRMSQGFQLNHDETKLVKYYEKFYTKNQATFDKLIKNATPYLYFVLTQTERAGLPSELALIPIVESDYDPLTINGTGRYDGMWQFTPMTGSRFGLNEDNNINDRKNIIKSTNAALAYFNYLNLMFKQWDVAIGSYNWGEGGMYKAIVASNQKIGNVTYSDLPLRKITAVYYPKIVALANIIQHPKEFGIKLDNIPNQPYFAIVHPTSNISINEITNQANINNRNYRY